MLEEEPTPYDILVRKELVERLHVELVLLPEREQVILCQHYLRGFTFLELAAMLSLSKARISQLHLAALLVLRKRLRACGYSGLAG